MATYGFDSNSKGRVEVYSKAETNSKINSEIGNVKSDIYISDPRAYQGHERTITIETGIFPGLMHWSSLGKWVTINIPLGLNPSYTQDEVKVSASFMRIITNQDYHVLQDESEIEACINNASLNPELGILTVAIDDGDNFFDITEAEADTNICLVSFDMLKLTFVNQGYKRNPINYN